MKLINWILIITLLTSILVRAIYQKPIEHFCQFQADAGMVCPLKVEQAGYIIKPYQEIPEDIQDQVEEHMTKEWEYDDEYIRRHWQPASGGVFYVLYKGNNFLGCVAVDRKNFYPYISQLYVVPKYRKQGYSQVLLDIGEEYTSMMGFNKARLWCEKKLVKYYEKMGWIVDHEKDGVYWMEKDI